MSDAEIAATSMAAPVRAQTRANDSDGSRIGAWGLALVFAVSWIFRFLSTTSFHNDQYMHLAWANQVLGGDWPIRDFVDPGMPLTYLASAAAQLLLGRGAWAEAVLSFTLLSIGAALTCHLAARASGSRLVGLAAALVQLVIAPRLYSAPKIVLPLWALWACWHYADRPSRRSLIALAACTATAFLVRHDHGAYIGAAAAALLFTLHWPKGATRVMTYSGCVALMLVPFFALRAVEWRDHRLPSDRPLHSRTPSTPGARSISRPRFDLNPVTLETPQINIRWAPTIDAATRTRLEAEHGLENPTQVHEQTWRYGVDRPVARQRAGIDQSPGGRRYRRDRSHRVTGIGHRRDDARSAGSGGQPPRRRLGHRCSQT